MPNLSTKNLVEVADIQGNAVLLNNGSLRVVIEVSAVNFELRSEDEQTGILQNFQRFLNSVDFPLQMVVNSRQLNMDEYLKSLDTVIEASENELLKIQASEYAKFVKELLQLSNIMSKKFYVVLPFYIYETPTKSGVMQSFKSIFNPGGTIKKIDATQLETYRTQLMQRADLVTDGLIGLGLKTKLLEREELINMFYGLYNPGDLPKVATEPT